MLSNVRAIEEFHCFTVISSQILKITLQKERWCRLRERERNTVKDVKYARTFFFFFLQRPELVFYKNYLARCFHTLGHINNAFLHIYCKLKQLTDMYFMCNTMHNTGI